MIHKNSKHVVPPNDSSLPEIPQPHMGLYLPPNDPSSPTGGAQKLPSLDDEPRHQFGAAQWLDDSSFDSTYHDKH